MARLQSKDIQINPLRTLTASLVLTVSLLFVVMMLDWRTYQDIRQTLVADLEVRELADALHAAPDVTAMAATMVRANNFEAMEPYEISSRRVDQLLERIVDITPSEQLRTLATNLRDTSSRLKEMERQAIALGRAGDKDAAEAVLVTEAFQKLRGIFDRQQAMLAKSASNRVDDSIHEVGQRAFLVYGFVSLSICLAIFTWVLTFLTVKRHLEDRARLVEELREMAVRDSLTGIYNRHGFMTIAGQHWRAGVRRDETFVMFFVDLDGLKWINDHLGHELGDDAIQSAAHLLAACFRSEDIVGRLGGDEFVVLAPTASPDDQHVMIARLQKRIHEFNSASRKPYTLGMSVGVIACHPANQTLDAALAAADEVMYANKKARRATRDSPPGATSVIPITREAVE